jgi:processive 1,2-diacylglycerol beta-glucosyltransferase
MRVLLLHASFGWGHKRAALALQEVLTERGIESECLDLLDFLPRPLSLFYSSSYHYMVTRGPWLWRLFYQWNDRPRTPYSPASSPWQKWQFEKLREYVNHNKFSHIICTHFTTSALMLDWREKYGWDRKIYSVVTDYTSHRCWKRCGLDHYFVATQEVANQLIDTGISPSCVTVSGIPISPRFVSQTSREECRENWCKSAEERLVLVLSSGLDRTKTRWLIHDLRQLTGNYRFLVSAGKHAPREQLVQDFTERDPRFTIFGFSPQISEMMKAADVLVSKPGGLTVSEALAVGLPEVLFSPIPGQEEANADFLVREGAAVCIKAQKGEFKKALENLFVQNDRLLQMSEMAKKLGKPDAARSIIDYVIS